MYKRQAHGLGLREDHGSGLIVDGKEDEVGAGSLRSGELNGEVGGGIECKGEMCIRDSGKRLFAVGDAEDSVTVFGEHVGEELTQLAVVLRNENFEQSDPSDPVSARRGFAALVPSVYHIFCKCAAGCAEILHGGKTAQKKSHPFG